MAAAKPKLIRNLTSYNLNLRFGSKKDPYHVPLSPRGQRGDVASIPAALKDHPEFASNQGVLFEIITLTQAEKVAEGYAAGGIIRPKGFENMTVTMERDQDNTVTVASIDISREGRITETNRRHGLEPSRAEIAGSEDGPDATERSIPSVVRPRVPKNKADTEETELPVFKGITR